MKKIINGKAYNTDTAREVGYNCGGGSYFDFEHWSETLYCKRTGEYFLHGEGGPMTRYAVSVDCNTTKGSERIVPMTYKEALRWAADNMTAEEYEREFGEVTEDGESAILSISLPYSVAGKARRAAREAGVTLSTYIASLI